MNMSTDIEYVLGPFPSRLWRINEMPAVWFLIEETAVTAERIMNGTFNNVAITNRLSGSRPLEDLWINS